MFQTAKVVPTTTDVPTTPIGLGKPLSIRALSMYPGRDHHRQLLVTSSVKSFTTFKAQPRALNYVFSDVRGYQLLQPSPSENGSGIVFYSPSVLDDRIDVELRFAYDDFDYDKVKKWLDLAATAAGLPVFAVATSLGGPGGAAAGKTILYFAEKVANVVLNALDGLVDNDNDWISTGKLSLDFGTSGIRESEPGYWLFYGDSAPASIVGTVNGDLEDQVFAGRETLYRVDPENGTLVYVDRPDEVVAEDEPYVLTYVNGAEEEALGGWKATAVTAALAEKFLNTSGDSISDLGALLEGYNDMQMATKYAETDAALKKKGLSADKKAKLTRERDAYLKYIQNDDVRDIVLAGGDGDDEDTDGGS